MENKINLATLMEYLVFSQFKLFSKQNLLISIINDLVCVLEYCSFQWTKPRRTEHFVFKDTRMNRRLVGIITH